MELCVRIYILWLAACFPLLIFESIAAADDPTPATALEQYHREGKTSNAEIKLLLKRDTGVDLRQVIEFI